MRNTARIRSGFSANGNAARAGKISTPSRGRPWERRRSSTYDTSRMPRPGRAIALPSARNALFGFRKIPHSRPRKPVSPENSTKKDCCLTADLPIFLTVRVLRSCSMAISFVTRGGQFFPGPDRISHGVKGPRPRVSSVVLQHLDMRKMPR